MIKKTKNPQPDSLEDLRDFRFIWRRKGSRIRGKRRTTGLSGHLPKAGLGEGTGTNWSIADLDTPHYGSFRNWR